MISQNLNKVKETLQPGTRLVAVSKYHPIEALQEAYAAGQRLFGESHVQELQQKQPLMPADVEWHFIGHLQTNKVKYIAPYISLIHSVDTIKLLKEIDKQGSKVGRCIPCLLQMHIAQEETKYGFSPDELIDILRTGEIQSLPHVQIAGLMCMATNTDDETQIRREFHHARTMFDQIRQQFFADDDKFSELSMGMSGDYLIAQQEGSTLVRVGSMIFGNRVYA